jgi:hypothetical protein
MKRDKCMVCGAREKRVRCDLCGENITLDKAWISWWLRVAEPHEAGEPIVYVPSERKRAEHVFITCEPHACKAAERSAGGRPVWPLDDGAPSGTMLCDSTATKIASIFVAWVRDYRVDAETAAKVAMRISPLLWSTSREAIQ